MCVIIVKQKGAEIPSRDEMRLARYFNPDGFGFVASSGLHYRGLDFEKFMTLLEMVPIGDECIIHLRYATHGSVKASNCHPFKDGDVWFAHNGVLSVVPSKDMTDSETAFRRFLYPVIAEYGLDSPELEEAVAGIIGWSRFAFMQGGRVKLFGQFAEHEGRLYSNMRHLWIP